MSKNGQQRDQWKHAFVVTHAGLDELPMVAYAGTRSLLHVHNDLRSNHAVLSEQSRALKFIHSVL